MYATTPAELASARASERAFALCALFARVRGVGSGLARSSRWNLYGDYLTATNAQVCLLVQVETVTAIAQLAEIVAVDGVDGVFIGPVDLSASMGLMGQPNHPQVRAVIEQAIATITAAGKAAGILCTDEVLARHYAHLGARFVAIGVDTSLLTQSARALASRFCGSGAPPAAPAY